MNKKFMLKDRAGPEGAGRGRLRHTVAAFAVAFAGAFAVPTMADAATLVSNTDQTYDDTYDVSVSIPESQEFRTNSNESG